MSKKLQADCIFLVISLSCIDGCRLPDGWLCASIIPVAADFNATPRISLESATVPVIPPLH